MKRFRVWIQADYELPDDSELVQVGGEAAIRLGDHVVRPNLDFLQLQEANAASSIWVEAEDEIYDLVISGERGLALDLIQGNDAT